ncbi:unnamed protein product [Clonostachys chloroleuca]|uniref:LrgB-like protein n=1 Tax=Clonostachys chloroleuca TaxID=1926264 RepID=A0AA35LZN4_9HYPO|nr:unnamed protein product [Clonostachys chloroleuca]
MTTSTTPAPDIGPIVSTIWRSRFRAAITEITAILYVLVLFLASELIIWGISLALAPVKIEYFSSILGMVLVFAIMTGITTVLPSSDPFYQQMMKPKIDFVNSHLGIGFPVPIVMLDPENFLNVKEVAKIICVCVITNLISWIICFVVACCVLKLAIRSCNFAIWGRLGFNKTETESRARWGAEATNQPKEETEGTSEPANGTRPKTPAIDLSAELAKTKSPVWDSAVASYPILLPALVALVVGTPIAAKLRDHRVLDMCILLCLWTTSAKSQRRFKVSRIYSGSPRIKRILTTIMNPVLLTTLLMIAYTRSKAAATINMSLTDLLHQFSFGTPLYAIWTSAAMKTLLTANPTRNFGAGDAALAFLECGVVVWGFKLYENRRQVFSLNGLLITILATLAAAFNVLIGVRIGQLVGLEPAEALAFAARCTTLALARPIMASLQGNSAVNAALVVTNGILGQLVCPYLVGVLDVKKCSDTVESQESSRYASPQENPAEASSSESQTPLVTEPKPQDEPESPTMPTIRLGDQEIVGTSPATTALNFTIGANAAAMGVAYLLEIRSPAAAFAVLSMIVYGVMTVVFATVEPMRSAVIALAA